MQVNSILPPKGAVVLSKTFGEDCQHLFLIIFCFIIFVLLY